MQSAITGTDRFALAAFSLAFTIKTIMEASDVPEQEKKELMKAFSRLRAKVCLIERRKGENHGKEQLGISTG